MYISKLNIEGYKNCKNMSDINFNKGLNIIVGENASGKTTIINSLRLILRDNEYSYMNITEDDFYRSFEAESKVENIKIDLEWDELSTDEEVTFLTWCDADFKAKLHLEVDKNPNLRGYYKKNVWGGASKASAFEEETFDCIDCIYLPPLRDAEERLRNGKKSRLAMLLEHQYKNDESKELLVKEVRDFNQSIVDNKEDKFTEIEKAKHDINQKINDSMGTVFGQTINLQFSETSFMSILKNIKMVFFPQIGETDIHKFRDIAINSLGYNNLLYIATVFAELEAIGREKNLFTVLLIEEPEAHLHPQLQIKLIKYLEQLAGEKNNIQIFVTTHSPVLASSVSIDNLIHITNNGETIFATQLSKLNINDDSKNYINRWLDITKSTLLFSKGVILVEGVSEAMLIPEFAKIVLHMYNQDHAGKELPTSLEEAGVSVVNINGINFKHFFKLFCNVDQVDSIRRLQFRCSGITDNDPAKVEVIEQDKDGEDKVKKEENYPLSEEKADGANTALKLKKLINKSTFARLFSSPLKTFEYDLAMNKNTKIMSEVIRSAWSKTGSVKTRLEEIEKQENRYSSDCIRLRKDSIFIYEHIEATEVGKGIFAQMLADKIQNLYNLEMSKDTDKDITTVFNVPKYIADAIIWACGGEITNE
ncbi:MAG: AAA family ATPase [Clostridiaceae bacterium]|nr:AAA family ATPase [Clostridiaceae bacterium]